MKKILLLSGLLCMATTLFAKNISVQIIQNGPAMNGNVCASSSLIEQTIVGYFFDSGYIVSSSPVFIGNDKDVNSLKSALQENAEGGMDYLVRVEVDYTPETSNPNAILLANIKQVTWKNYAVSSGEELSAGSETIGTVNRQNNNENGVTSFANLVAAKINAGLRAR